MRDLRKSWRADAIIRVPKQDLWRNSTAASGRFVAAFMLRLLMLTGWRRPVEAEDVREVLHQMFPGGSIVGDKRPYYLWQLGELTRIQNMLGVVIYRDCRDVVRSSLRMYESAWRGNEKKSSAKRIAEQWVEAVELMRRHADAIHTVRYEAFVTEPVAGVERLGQYLGVSPGGFQVEAVHARRVGKWQRELSRRQVDDVLAVAEPTLDRLGYSLSSPIST